MTERLPHDRRKLIIVWGNSNVNRNKLCCRETGDVASFPACKVVEGCPVPIVIFCGEKSEILTRVFADVHASLQAGAKGIAIGRNIWQHGKTRLMVEAMVGLVHENWTVAQALAHVGP